MLNSEVVMLAWSERLMVDMKLISLLASGVASQEQINSTKEEGKFYETIIGGYRE